MICDWIGHKFRPRFNRRPAPGAIFEASAMFSSDIVKVTTRTDYVLDICERCGAVVKDEVLIAGSYDPTVRA